MDNKIKQAIGILKDGGIVIYPTDTAFGIGCRIDDKNAVDRLFTIRKRSREKAVPILVDSIDMALAYFDSPSNIVRHFMKTYWPGALTIVYTCKKNLVYSPILGGSEKIGLRSPNHQTTIALIKGIGVPILGPSANFSGEKTPYLYEEIDPELTKRVDLVVPGNSGAHGVSTVVDATMNPYRILRQGIIIL